MSIFYITRFSGDFRNFWSGRWSNRNRFRGFSGSYRNFSSSYRKVQSIDRKYFRSVSETFKSLPELFKSLPETSNLLSESSSRYFYSSSHYRKLPSHYRILFRSVSETFKSLPEFFKSLLGLFKSLPEFFKSLLEIFKLLPEIFGSLFEYSDYYFHFPGRYRNFSARNQKTRQSYEKISIDKINFIYICRLMPNRVSQLKIHHLLWTVHKRSVERNTRKVESSTRRKISMLSAHAGRGTRFRPSSFVCRNLSQKKEVFY